MTRRNRQLHCAIASLTLALTLAPSLAASARAGDVFIDAGRGPVRVHVPSSYEPGVAIPLVVALHGYGSSGAAVENYLRLAPLAEELGFLYTHPDGTTDPGGARFWNATDACCDFFDSGVDDSGYLIALVQAIEAQLTVDPRRIYFGGHSNGGFMSYRMACDHAEAIAAIASLAGATWNDPATCSPIEPVHVLQIHGTNDTVIRYAGGQINGAVYPGAIASVEQWASFGGCDLIPDTGDPPLDLDSSIPGAESTVRRYADLCAPGGSGELWSIVGGAHSPNLTPGFGRLVIEYLLAHPKLDPAGAPEASASEGSLSLRTWPAPFTEGCWIELGGAGELGAVELRNVRIVLADAAGRRVATLQPGRAGTGVTTGGTLTVYWDGRSEDGVPVKPGLYFAAVQGLPVPSSTKLIRLP